VILLPEIPSSEVSHNRRKNSKKKLTGRGRGEGEWGGGGRGEPEMGKRMGLRLGFVVYYNFFGHSYNCAIPPTSGERKG